MPVAGRTVVDPARAPGNEIIDAAPRDRDLHRIGIDAYALLAQVGDLRHSDASPHLQG